MAQADAEDRLLADQLAHLLRLVFAAARDRRGRSRETRRRASAPARLRPWSRGHHGDARAHLHQPPQDIALDPEVVRDHVAARLGGVGDAVGRRARQPPAGPRRSSTRWRRAWPDPGPPWRATAARVRPAPSRSPPPDRKNAAHHAARPQVAHQRARVDLGGDRDSVVGKKLLGVLFRAPVAGDARELAHHQAFDVRAAGFLIVLRWRRSCRFAGWSERRSARQ